MVGTTTISDAFVNNKSALSRIVHSHSFPRTSATDLAVNGSIKVGDYFSFFP